VIEEVQVDDEVIQISAEVGTLRRIKQIPAAAIALTTRRTIPQRQKDPARVLIEPPHIDGRVERRRKLDATDQHHGGAVLLAARNAESPTGFGRGLQLELEPHGRVVRPVRQASLA